MDLTEIEKEKHFQYPQLYKQLETDGMLDVGDYGPNWYSDIFPKLKDQPTLLLHSYDFELLNPKAVDEAIKELSDPENYQQIKSEFKFIPFGQSEAGDHYCFLVSEQDEDDIPIVLLWHDSSEANYLAKNLQDYIFRAILTDMSEQDTYNDVDDEEFKNNLSNTLKTHTKYLTEAQTKILSDIFTRDIKDYDFEVPKGRKETRRGLLTDTELKKILAETIPYEKIDQTFEYAEE